MSFVFGKRDCVGEANPSAGKESMAVLFMRFDAMMSFGGS